MDLERAAPPAADRCLVFSYASRGQKGGTLIEESVLDLASHEARMMDPAWYRPPECRCGCPTLHLHQLRERRPRGMLTSDGGFAVVRVVIFLCSSCSATWRVLPGFLARCLWRTWAAVEKALLGEEQPGEAVAPARTQQRWRARLAQAARAPAQTLAASGAALLRGVAQAVGLDSDRAALAKAYAATFVGATLAALAALLHRLSPGIRLI